MSNGWFAGLDPDDDAAAVEQIAAGRADAPEDWPQQAVEAGFADDEAAYYDRLHEVTMAATSAAVAEQEGADDQQLVHAVRAMADCERTANELAERVAEWGGSRYGDSGSGVEYARSLADRDSNDEGDRALQSLAERTAALANEADSLRAYIERTAPAVAPNL
jgi:nucleolar protein 56